MTANLAAVFDLAEPERSSRLREPRMAAHLLLGRKHPVTIAAVEAIADPSVVDVLLGAIDDLESIPRRRLLATMAAALPSR
jgi:hypothetical protein